MTGEELRELFMNTLDPALLGGLVEEYGVQQRDRKLNVTELLLALILTGGTHEGGRQYDVLRTYLENTSTKVLMSRSSSAPPSSTSSAAVAPRAVESR